MRGTAEQIVREATLIIVKVIRTFKHDSRAFLEQRLIDRLVGLRRMSEPMFETYIHANLIDKFIDWLNNNNPEKTEKWEAIALDTPARLVLKQSDDLSPLVIGRIKIGYTKGSENQAYYQNLLTQVFNPRSLKGWRF